MNYDTIKLLNLEDINIDLTKSHVDKVNGKLECTIVLNNTITSCKECGSRSPLQWCNRFRGNRAHSLRDG